MLYRYRFDLTNASSDQRNCICEKVDRLSETGVSFASKDRSVFTAFFDETVDISALIPIPNGCSVQRLHT